MQSKASYLIASQSGENRYISVNEAASDSANSMRQNSMFIKITSHNVHVTSASIYKLYKVRAIIDQGFQSSFVSQVLLQKLKLPWKKSISKIYGVCNSQRVDVNGETTLVMSSRHNSNVRLKGNVDVLHFIAKFQPLSYQCRGIISRDCNWHIRLKTLRMKSIYYWEVMSLQHSSKGIQNRDIRYTHRSEHHLLMDVKWCYF